MAGAFSEQAFEQKLCSLKDTQESINAMSTWCLKNKEHHKKIVTCWLHCLKRVKIDQRLSLFYLANDVIQYSKRKHLDFVNSWGTALQKATTLVRDDKVRNRIMRIFKIWEERGVYDEPFITDLCGLLTTHVKKKEPEISDPAEFQPSALIKKVRECCLLEENTDNRYRRVKEFKLPLTDAESMRLSLKDRRHGSDVAAEVDSGVKKMEAYVKALENEISSREKLIDILRQAMIFYESQRGEAKIVANAYKNFGGRLKQRQKTLEELVPTLLSPLPSPDVNAPSPSPDPDLEGEQHMTTAFQPAPVFNGGELDFSFSSSFIGSQFMDLHKDVFTNEPPPNHESIYGEAGHEGGQNGGQSIQVIGTRADPNQSFNVAEFLKSLMPTKETALPPPPMPPTVFGDWTGVPWEPPPETPQSPPLYEKQGPHVQPVEYDDSLPVPPVPDVDHRSLLSGPPLVTADTDHRLPPVSMDGPPPPLGVDMDHRLHQTMEYPPALMMEPPLRMDIPPPLTPTPSDHHNLLMDRPPPMRMEPPMNPPDLDPLRMRMEPPPNPPELDALRMRMELPPNPPELDALRMRMELPPNPPELDALRMRMEPPPNPPELDALLMRMEPPPNPPDLERLLSLERGAILAGPTKCDIDRRTMKGIKSSGDVDRRNLISLTGSPGVVCSDNVESVDMDVSEEDDDESQARAFGDGERRFHSGPGPRRTGPVGAVGGMQPGARFQRNTNIRYPAPEEDLPKDEVDQCAGAKLIPIQPVDTPDRNGHPATSPSGPRPLFSTDFRPPSEFSPRPRGEFLPRGDFSLRQRWRSPRPNMPYRTPQPFRANFRPRGRW